MPPSTSPSAFSATKEALVRCYVVQPRRLSKKDSNFEACRDMSGRRLRHVNAEKRAEIRENCGGFSKEKGENWEKRVEDGEAEKYVAKYREQSARCVAVVEDSIKAACLNRKRKAVPGGVDPKSH